MKQPSRILLFTLAGVLLLTFGWFVLRPREPSYQGKTLTEWVKNAGANYWLYSNTNTDAVKAIRRIGSKAVPTLLTYAEAKDTPLKKFIWKWDEKLPPFLSLHVSTQRNQQAIAQIGFKILGPEAKWAVPHLLQLLKDDDDSVRVNAAYCLGLIGPAAQSAVPDLIKEFEQEKSSTNQNYAAAQALGMIGGSAQAAIPSLKAGLTNQDIRCREVSQAALINIHAISISPVLEQLKAPTNANQWIDAIAVLQGCGTNAIPAVPFLISALKSTNGSIQSISLFSLGWLHSEPQACLPAIVPFLSSGQDYLKQNAINALHGFGKEAKPAVPALLRCLNDENFVVRSFATNALGDIDPDAATKAGIK